jgi:Vacuolar protein sorting-associated protein 62
MITAGHERRADWLEVVELLLVLLAAVVYIYVIGWVISWVRLTAARIPVDASLPMLDHQVVFLAGLRLVVVMAIVFGAMCLAAYAVHAFTWQHSGPEWHSVIKHGRPAAAARHRDRPAVHMDAPVGDRFVRVIAGFDVGVIAGTFALALARVLKTFIDQAWPPGPWWDVLLPWALLTALFAFGLARLGPLWGSRLFHAALWIVVIVVALVSSAPIGLLLLTWAAVASLGRQYGKLRSQQGRGALAAGHPRHLSFVFSPLPWMLLTVYGLVGVAYYGLPPVTFSQASVTTATGARIVGGYLARNSTGAYVVTCTPLADATSTNERVSLTPATDIRSMTTSTTPFVVDSGLRPSLPTVLLHTVGIDASTPAWIRPEVRTVRPTCAGAPLPVSSVGYSAPSLGAGVIGGPTPQGGRAVDGEAPIEQTSPAAIAALARRYQPTVLVTAADPFWPVSVGAVLADRGPDGQLTCLQEGQATCPAKPSRQAPTTADLGETGSGADDFLEYPVSPALTTGPNPQLAAFLRGQQAQPGRLPTLRQRLANPGLVDPWRTAQVYFYYARNTNPATWPAPDRAITGNFIALQYWFFYPYNFYPTVVTTGLMNDAPVSADLVNTDLHQGDWEHVTVLLDAKTKAPLWLYTARHSNEGEYYAWNSPLLTFDQGHVVVQAAYGGHPTYDAHCRQSLRFNPALGVLRGRVSDWVVCGSGRFAFRAQTTPLVDIAKTPWACWKGHFGVATASEIGAAKLKESSIQRTIDSNYQVAGPRSPLWQAENGRLAADQTAQAGKPAPVDNGVCAGGADPAAPENAGSKSGL